MDTYLIGGGAILETGPRSTITRAMLHAQVCRPTDLGGVVFIDFESGSLSEMRRVVAIGAGMSAEHFAGTVTPALQTAGVCDLEDVAAMVGDALGTRQVDVFARWAPSPELRRAFIARGLDLRFHPLESIEQAALVADHRFALWPSRRAA